MAPSVLESSGPVPESLIAPLKEHLPHSFAVLRRAQFTQFPNGISPHAHFLFASEPLPRGSAGAATTSPPYKHFAAAYLDLSQGPETQMFLYSTLQDAGDDDGLPSVPDAEVEHVLDLCAAIFARVRVIAADTAADGRHALYRAHGAMVGNFHEATYQLLVARRGLVSSYWNPHDVWLFRVDELPPPEDQLETSSSSLAKVGEEGLVWSVVRREDVPLIASRTSLPKVADTLMSEPSVAVRRADGTLVAWGFMGIAGTLSTLHVEVSRAGVRPGGERTEKHGLTWGTGAISWEGHRKGACDEGDAGA